MSPEIAPKKAESSDESSEDETPAKKSAPVKATPKAVPKKAESSDKSSEKEAPAKKPVAKASNGVTRKAESSDESSEHEPPAKKRAVSKTAPNGLLKNDEKSVESSEVENNPAPSSLKRRADTAMDAGVPVTKQAVDTRRKSGPFRRVTGSIYDISEDAPSLKHNISWEAVFQNDVLVRQLISHLISGPVILLQIALINKKFCHEICSRLRQVSSLDFYSSTKSESSSEVENTPKSGNDGNEKVAPVVQYGFNGMLSNDLSIFISNLSFVTHHSQIISLNFEQLGDDCTIIVHLLRLKGIQSLKFHPLQRHSTNVVYHQLFDKNWTTLKTLIHPPEIFFKSLLQDDACLDLNSLEIDIGAFRSLLNSFHFQLPDAATRNNFFTQKFKIKYVTFYGANQADGPSLAFILNRAISIGVSKLKMICEKPIVTESKDLMVFQECKNREIRFFQFKEFELIFWNDILRNHYDTAISVLLDVFTNLTTLKFGSQQSYSADECFEVIEKIQQYWKNNSLGKCEHSVHLNSAIPKEQMKNFELRLLTHKSHRNLSKSCEIWFYTMRINYEDSIQIIFQFL